MRHRSFALFFFSAALAVSPTLRASADEAPAPRQPEPKLEYLFLEFGGLDEAKGAAVEKAVTAVKGVTSFLWTTSLADAKIVREVGLAPDATLVTAATTAGAKTAGVVPIAVATLTFKDALHCAGCVKDVTKTLRAIKAVKQVDVPPTMDTVSIVFDTRTGKIEEFEKALVAIEKPTKTRVAGAAR